MAKPRNHPMGSHTRSISLTPAEDSVINERGIEVSRTVRRIVGRYAMLVREAEYEIASRFTSDEIRELCELLSANSYDDPRMTGLLHEDVRHATFDAWDKIVRLSPAERVALIDMVERYAAKQEEVAK